MLRWTFLAVPLIASSLLVGCGDGDASPPPPWSGPSSADRAEDEENERKPGEGGPPGCKPGAVKSCKVFFPKQGDVQNCFVGERVCGDDGSWGPCDEPITPPGQEVDEPWAMPERAKPEVSHVAV